MVFHFGVIETDKNGRLIHYIEKPTYHFNVSMGVNILNLTSIKPYIVPGEYLDIPDLLSRLAGDDHFVQTYQEKCYWLDIGRADDYQLANETFESREAEFFQTEEL